jgi:phytoene synthase
MLLAGLMKSQSPIPVSDGIVARSGSNFTASFVFLPERKRHAVKTFYAFCRELDDGVDRAEDRESALECVRFWKAEMDRIHRGTASTPLGEEIDEMVHAHDLSLDNFDLMIEGVEMDIVRSRYETFEELYGYCYRVASTVGFVCCEILGASGGSIMRYAELTGIGVQLTNILRDVGEDAAMGRIYLPLEDLRRFGVTESQVMEGRAGEDMLRLLRFEGARAAECFKLGQGVLTSVDAARVYFCHLLSGTYMAILKELMSSGFGLGRPKVKVSTGRKLGMGFKTALTALVGTMPL